ncbi:MAG: glutamine--tRNA ligase/YqeY domain fusion protein [Saprospiraceae bacterium]|nr:glutamine--tRNA ligase/YqeY domain fusion protein [Saprospiraceae bacterium]
MEHTEESLNFIEQMIEDDIAAGKHGGRVLTRFPPEPNGYLHIGHAKSIVLNFGVAQKYGGKTNLRFDDTNPVTEDTEYVESIQNDIRWLGFDWEDRLFYASDYFDQIFGFALRLIDKGLAYVDDSSAEEIAALKGTPTHEGTDSPFRNRSIEENRQLFLEMRDGKHPEGSKVLRAKVDMASPNMLLRDPVIYRIKFAHHHRTADKWCIYPMYDFAHGQSDSIETITHSLCTLEFENHRPLYDWFIEQLGIFPSKQTEFARLNLNYTIMSKRKLLQLVNDNHVNGWDDPRMPTISGMRRRGYPPAAIRNFVKKVGVARRENVIDVGLLEFSVRQELNKTAPRVMAVLDPLKVVITNYPQDRVEWMHAENNPEDPEAGHRELPFSSELYIEQDDFMENPPKKYFRMFPGGMVRLKNAYIIQCDEVIKNEDGSIEQLNCTYIETSKSGEDTSGINVKGTIHWVSRAHALKVEARMYDRLFSHENPDHDKDQHFTAFLNPESLVVKPEIYVEPSLADALPGQSYQFMRKGYFCVDTDSTANKLVFNLTVNLRDNWGKS